MCQDGIRLNGDVATSTYNMFIASGGTRINVTLRTVDSLTSELEESKRIASLGECGLYDEFSFSVESDRKHIREPKESIQCRRYYR